MHLKVLKRDIPWETYMSTKLITGTHLQLLRRYDNKSDSQKASLLDDVSISLFPFSYTLLLGAFFVCLHWSSMFHCGPQSVVHWIIVLLLSFSFIKPSFYIHISNWKLISILFFLSCVLNYFHLFSGHILSWSRLSLGCFHVMNLKRKCD